MASITRLQILRQLKKDLIGKDSYRGVTLTYAWLANQLGHITLGFILGFTAFHIFSWLEISNAPAWAGVAGGSIWLIFELYNFLGPLRKKGAYTFEPAWANVAFDTATDVCFFFVGSFLASLMCGYNAVAVYGLIITVLLLCYPVSYWFPTKMYLQEAAYPMQFRLSQWAYPIQACNKQTIENFLKHPVAGKHLLVFGTKGTGKTSISVGLATEYSIKHNYCNYITATKLLSMFFEPEKEDPSSIWTWRNSSLLVIDDINPGDPISDLLLPEVFYDCLNNPPCRDHNIKALKEKSVIWVLGNEGADGVFKQKWEKMLMDIGIASADISTVNLNKAGS